MDAARGPPHSLGATPGHTLRRDVLYLLFCLVADSGGNLSHGGFA